ncbi:MAG: hypothetical protein JWS10_2207 [Cypionkella sp.]|nr:hypothetical protein [Cypionkella sp.]
MPHQREDARPVVNPRGCAVFDRVLRLDLSQR